jgi:hypothetical protein
MLHKLRVFLETDGPDVYRDIEIQDTASLEDLHNTIVQSFDFDGTQMASFYLTDDELNQGMEIPLFNMDDTKPANNLMSNTLLKDVLSEENPNLLYVYDFLNMWRFLVNLMETGEEAPGIEYPQVAHAQGIRPEYPPEIDFNSTNDEDMDHYDDHHTDNPFGEFYDYDDDEWN